MCTVITTEQLFSRTMDFPPRTPWKLTYLPADYQWQPAIGHRVVINHHRILGGMRYFAGHYLIGDGINDAGLVCAELFFPVAADYQEWVRPQTLALTPQDFINWVLGSHDSVAAVLAELNQVSVVGQPWFDRQQYPFHWLLMDRRGTFVIEPLNGRLRARPNPASVFTNTPDLNQQVGHLNTMLGLTGHQFSRATIHRLQTYSQPEPQGGSSVDRFKRAALARWRGQPNTSQQLRIFLQDVTVPHNQRHAHNYTHYQAIIDRYRGEYTFYDLTNGQEIHKNLALLTGPVPNRF